MIVFTDNEGRIKDVGTTTDETLILHEINDTDNPFKGWSVAKICCYKIYTSQVPIYPEVEETEESEEEQEEVEPIEPIGYKTVITGYTPYIDSRLLDHIDQLGRATEAITPYTDTKTAYIGDTEITFYNVPEGNVTIFFDKPYTVERLADRITVSFEELEEVTEVTISIL